MKHAKTIIILVLVVAAFVAAVAVSRARLATQTSIPAGPSAELSAIADRYGVELVSFKEIGGGEVHFSLRTSPPNSRQTNAVVAAAVADGVIASAKEVGVMAGSGLIARSYEVRYFQGTVEK